MSIGLQNLIVLVLFFLMSYGVILLISSIIKRNKTKIILSFGVLATGSILFLGFEELLSYEYQNDVFGSNFDNGKTILEFRCCYDHHGDGTDVKIFNGKQGDYHSINIESLKSFPSSSLNLNNYKHTRPWQPISQQNNIDIEAIDLAEEAINSLNGSKRPKAESIFSSLIKQDGTFYAYIYDGSRSIDFWLINPDLATYIQVNFYN